MDNNFWNLRYSSAQYAYGELPNEFLAAQLPLLKAGRILFPCEGEGRNAVFAASLGWQVEAFDGSEEGKRKALALASSKNVSIQYVIADANYVVFEQNSFDVIALVYVHFPPSLRKEFHKKCVQWLKPGGKIILEAFEPAQLGNTSGGPKEIDLLYTKEALEADFEGCLLEYLEYETVQLNEGVFHEGTAKVVRMIGKRSTLHV